MYLRCLLAVLLLFFPAFVAQPSPAQSTQYTFRQSFSVFGEYSNTSSRIILGAAQNRRFLAFGLIYFRRLHHGRFVDWYYAPELLPLAFVQDPVATDTFAFTGEPSSSRSSPTVSSCRTFSTTVPLETTAFNLRRTCGTRWTYAGGLSPLGQRLNFRPGRRLQPFLAANAGFLVSPHDVPINLSSRFNFTFEFGGGIEFFRSPRHSWSLEYRLHHLSNDYIGATNPGVDNQVLRLTYTMGH